MNAEERQALREKHFLYHFNKCGECFLSYPCDTIKVLDALDHIAAWVDHRNGMDVHGAIGRIQDMLLGTTTEPECDHIEDGYDSTDEGLVYSRFNYCPKCGEKL